MMRPKNSQTALVFASWRQVPRTLITWSRRSMSWPPKSKSESLLNLRLHGQVEQAPQSWVVQQRSRLVEAAAAPADWLPIDMHGNWLAVSTHDGQFGKAPFMDKD